LRGTWIPKLQSELTSVIIRGGGLEARASGRRISRRTSNQSSRGHDHISNGE
jgi:hypothetical protein